MTAHNKILRMPFHVFRENQQRVIRVMKDAERAIGWHQSRVPDQLRNEINRQEIILNRAVTEYLPVHIKRIKSPR